MCNLREREREREVITSECNRSYRFLLRQMIDTYVCFILTHLSLLNLEFIEFWLYNLSSKTDVIILPLGIESEHHI